MSIAQTPAPDISGLNGHFLPQQLWSAVLLLAFLLFIFAGLRILTYVRRPKLVDPHAPEAAPTSSTRFATFVGLDNRVSTSRTIALLWTVVVAYCLLTLVLIATARHSSTTPIPTGRIPDGFIGSALNPLAPAYVVLLGAPFAAAVGAKVIVSQSTSTGRVQKTRNTLRPSPLDLVTDDDANVDLIDLQYTLFNLIAATYVLTQFVPHPARGIPDVPAALAILIGVSATTYTANKATTSNRATIDTVLTPTVYPGDLVTLSGQYLVVNPDPEDPSTDARRTTIGLWRVTDGTDSSESGTLTSAVTDASEVTPDTVNFAAPENLRPGVWNIRVRTNAGGTAMIRSQLTVLTPRVAREAAESIGTP